MHHIRRGDSFRGEHRDAWQGKGGNGPKMADCRFLHQLAALWSSRNQAKYSSTKYSSVLLLCRIGQEAAGQEGVVSVVGLEMDDWRGKDPKVVVLDWGDWGTGGLGNV